MSDGDTPRKIKAATIAAKINPIKIIKNTANRPPKRKAGKINIE
jgi:hypothetical protein